jgi:hypothetical protein
MGAVITMMLSIVGGILLLWFAWNDVISVIFDLPNITLANATLLWIAIDFLPNSQRRK